MLEMKNIATARNETNPVSKDQSQQVKFPTSTIYYPSVAWR